MENMEDNSIKNSLSGNSNQDPQTNNSGNNFTALIAVVIVVLIFVFWQPITDYFNKYFGAGVPETEEEEIVVVDKGNVVYAFSGNVSETGEDLILVSAGEKQPVAKGKMITVNVSRETVIQRIVPKDTAEENGLMVEYQDTVLSEIMSGDKVLVYGDPETTNILKTDSLEAQFINIIEEGF